jgi:hypothetical protein
MKMELQQEAAARAVPEFEIFSVMRRHCAFSPGPISNATARSWQAHPPSLELQVQGHLDKTRAADGVLKLA